MSAVRRASGAFSQLIRALPSSNNRILLPPDPKTLVFLGTFENRKGIAHVMAIWPKVLKLLPESKLMLLGKLGNVSDVREFAASFSSVTLLEDPTRVKIFDVLARSKALILFSQPARGWKEQVGLPIVEALSMGCEIISSDQTGIQSWLAGHGHQVVDWSGSADVLAAAVVRALESERSKSDIVGDLPSEDGRALADRALFMEPQVQ